MSKDLSKLTRGCILQLNGGTDRQVNHTPVAGSTMASKYDVPRIGTMISSSGQFTYAKAAIHAPLIKKELEMQWSKGVINPEVVNVDGEGQYVGQYRDGKMHGKGKKMFAHGDQYEGEWW